MKEFLRQRLAPLQAHSRPMWELMGDDDKLRLRSGMLPSSDLDLTSSILLETMPADLPVAHLPLYRRPDKAEQLKAVSGYGEVAEPAPATGDVSSSGEEESEEEEEDSEKALGDLDLNLDAASSAESVEELPPRAGVTRQPKAVTRVDLDALRPEGSTQRLPGGALPRQGQRPLLCPNLWPRVLPTFGPVACPRRRKLLPICWRRGGLARPLTRECRFFRYSIARCASDAHFLMQ